MKATVLLSPLQAACGRLIDRYAHFHPTGPGGVDLRNQQLWELGFSYWWCSSGYREWGNCENSVVIKQ